MIRSFTNVGLLSLLWLMASCNIPEQEPVPANMEHVLRLVDSLVVDGEVLYWIAIYADAPSYKPVTASGEGVTCVDDVGRFLEVLEFEIIHHQREDLLPVAEGMVKYLLYLSHPDGRWNNFMFADGSINQDYRTSVASFGWWAVRGLRGLGAGYRIFANRFAYTDLTQRISSRFMASQAPLDSLFSNYLQMTLADDGSLRPSWNLNNAPDQTAELLMALAGVHGLGEFSYAAEIKMLAEALMGWQYRGEQERYQGMYFCWQNTWHGWGNNQALALLQAYILLEDEKYLASVKLWADHFIPGLIAADFPAEISLDSMSTWQVRAYPQIAYGLTSSYRGMKTLAAITGEPEYAARADELFAWFQGRNAAHTQMYDPQTGRCFDGISGNTEVNLNSGAESTIECLLAIQTRGGWSSGSSPSQ